MAQFFGLLFAIVLLGAVMAEGLDQAATRGEQIRNTPGYSYGAMP